MSKRCPDCGQINEDSRIFCSACGEPLNADIRLIKGLEKQQTSTSKAAPVSRRDDDDEYVPPKAPPKKAASPAPWIVLGLILLVAALWLILR